MIYSSYPQNIVVEFCVSNVDGGVGGLPYNPGDNAPGTTCAPPPPAGDEVGVAGVATGTRGIGGGNKVGTATITLYDENGNPVGAGYTVIGDFSGTLSQSGVSGVTGADSTVTVETAGSAKGKVNVDFCVSDVSGGTNTYNSGLNAPGTTCSP